MSASPSGADPTVAGMYRIVIWTSKGGTGKTTTAANVAPELARLGYRVLLVGFDPTTDLEATFGVNDDDEQIVRVEQLLDRVDAGRVWDATIPVDVERLPRRAGRRASGLVTGQLRLLACSPALAAQTAAVSGDGYRGLAHVLEAIDDRVDLAVIDTQGAFTTLSHAAAVAADGVVFVGEPGAYERRALEVRLVELEQLRQQGAAVAADARLPGAFR
jgi:chromosome partitioning protein